MFTEYINTCTIPTFSQHCLFSLFSLTFISLVSDALSVSPSLLSSLFVYLSLQHSHYLSLSLHPYLSMILVLFVLYVPVCLVLILPIQFFYFFASFYLSSVLCWKKSGREQQNRALNEKTTTNILTDFFVAQLQEQAPEQDGSHGYGYNEIDQGKFSGRHADVDQDIYLRVAKNSAEKTEEISGWTWLWPSLGLLLYRINLKLQIQNVLCHRYDLLFVVISWATMQQKR